MRCSPRQRHWFTGSSRNDRNAFMVLLDYIIQNPDFSPCDVSNSTRRRSITRNALAVTNRLLAKRRLERGRFWFLNGCRMVKMGGPGCARKIKFPRLKPCSPTAERAPRLASSRSPTTHSQHAFRITITLHCDFRGRTVDFAQVVWREFDCERAIVLVEARQLGRARDRNNPRLLRKQPRQRDLCRCRLLLFRDSAQQIHQRLIRFAVFWSEARDDGTEIGAIELGIFGDFASEEAPAERAEWNE